MNTPAFPTVKRQKGRLVRVEGMTLRDHFAGLAMQGFCTRADEPWDLLLSLNKGEKFIAHSMADFAYMVADAMLEARAA